MANRFANFRALTKKIVAVGRNYTEHAKELNNPLPTEPILFLKSTSCYIGEGERIRIPAGSSELHHEVELGIIIGRTSGVGSNGIKRQSAFDYVAGYCLALDMTDRAVQNRLKTQALPWTLAKCFDTALPVSRFIEKHELVNAQDTRLWLKVNGKMKQDDNTRNMLFNIPVLLEFITQRMRLEEGDLLLTGTPEGVGPVRKGDVIECGMANVVTMRYEVE